MSPEEKRMLQEALQFARENNSLIKKMRRSMVVGRVIRTIYWVVLIGVTVGAFYFIQPYLDTVKSFYGGIGDPQDAIRSLFLE